MTDLLGKRVYWPHWNEAGYRATGIVRAVDGSDGWRLLVEREDGMFESVRAGEATTQGPAQNGAAS